MMQKRNINWKGKMKELSTCQLICTLITQLNHTFCYSKPFSLFGAIYSAFYFLSSITEK